MNLQKKRKLCIPGDEELTSNYSVDCLDYAFIMSFALLWINFMKLCLLIYILVGIWKLRGPARNFQRKMLRGDVYN